MATVEQGYVLGHSTEELERLDRQGAILRPLSARMLTAAGISPGMRVLDIGCGTGDLSLVVSELVGPGGRVTGVDRAPEALAAARDRFAFHGLSNGEFVDHDLATGAPAGVFDAVVGRLVLVHLPDPVETLRRLTAAVRPGGVIASIDIIHPDRGFELRPSELMAQCQRWLNEVFGRIGAPLDMGLRQALLFQQAGLGRPQMLIEGVPVIGADAAVFQWLAGTVRSVAPTLVKLGLATESEIGIDTLAARLIAEASSDGFAAVPVLYAVAWTTTTVA